MATTPITVAYGDGIGPEIMDATLNIITAGGADLSIETIEIGEQVYLRGINTGIEDSAWESLLRTKVFLKAPITTPQGSGYKSLNVSTRKTLGLYANIRPCVSYHPYVDTKHAIMDVVIIRENEEDLYAGIEHRQTQEVYQCLKLITRPGTEKIVRYAFEYARVNNRKKVTCFAKDNIMKMTDGLFHRIFDEIGSEYPEIEKEFWIVDIGAAKLADSPELFDVIVMPNLYGDILSDVAAQIAGSVGLAGSANVGDHAAMFEAIHGSAPRRAGQNLANPSGLILGSLLMLQHIGQRDVAARVHNAWLKTLEDGVHTYDIFKEGVSKQKVGTKEFAQAVIDRMGEMPTTLKAADYGEHKPMNLWTPTKHTVETKTLVGVDVFIEDAGTDVNAIGDKVNALTVGSLSLNIITNRGVRVYPHGRKETFCTDHYRCRFKSNDGSVVTHDNVIALLQAFNAAGFDFIKTEHLYQFDGVDGFSSTH